MNYSELRNAINGNYRSCMQRYLIDEDDPSQGFVQADEDRVNIVKRIVSESIDNELLETRTKLSELADDLEETTERAILDPGFMNLYFDCSRSRYRELSELLGKTEEQRISAVTDEQCNLRNGSAWVACRYFRDYVDDAQVQGVFVAYSFVAINALLMNSLSVGAFGVSHLAHMTALQIGTRMLMGGMVAGSIGVGLTYATDANSSDIESRSDTDIALFRSGTGNIDAYHNAIEQLTELADSWFSPEVESGIHGFIFGAVLGLLHKPVVRGSRPTAEPVSNELQVSVQLSLIHI